MEFVHCESVNEPFVKLSSTCSFVLAQRMDMVKSKLTLSHEQSKGYFDHRSIVFKHEQLHAIVESATFCGTWSME